MPSICDRPAGLLSLAEAIQRLQAAVTPVAEVETVPVSGALGRVLATDLPSPLDLPPFTQSAMDGYAVRAAEARPDVRLAIAGTAWAGRPHETAVGPGQCVRIFTGAPLPEGLDAVVVQEEAQRAEEFVTLHPRQPARPGDNVRQRGEELRTGDPLLPAGRCLQAADLGLLAMAGCQQVAVRRRLRVAYLATGDELVLPGEPPLPGSLYESNRPVLAALLTELGMAAVDLGVVRDDREALRQALREGARRADVLLTTGGASVGEADHVVELLREEGEVDFWKVAIKPGKPFVCGRLGTTPVFGLPGNPVSMMVTFLQLARPALLRMAGRAATAAPRWRAVCRQPVRKPAGRLEFLRGWLDWQADPVSVTPFREQGSHRLTSMSRANCFIVLPAASTGVAAGELVEVEPFGIAPAWTASADASS